jgi:hypothetical protein
MPRRQLTLDFFGGYAPGAEPHSLKTTWTEGRSHFLTSGGEAVPTNRIVTLDGSGQKESVPVFEVGDSSFQTFARILDYSASALT